jgi:hypothetical protein
MTAEELRKNGVTLPGMSYGPSYHEGQPDVAVSQNIALCYGALLEIAAQLAEFNALVRQAMEAENGEKKN